MPTFGEFRLIRFFEGHEFWYGRPKNIQVEDADAWPRSWCMF